MSFEYHGEEYFAGVMASGGGLWIEFVNVRCDFCTTANVRQPA